MSSTISDSSTAVGRSAMKTGTADYEVVLVTYHSRDQLAGLLANARVDQRIVVVDNASGADGVAEELTRFPHGRCLDGGNVGFAGAANIGARSSSAQYLVFSNPDSRPTPEVWDALVADLAADPTLGSVAASTIDKTGHIEIGVGGWEPTPLRVVVYAFGLHRVFTHAGTVARPEIGEQVQLGWLTGACLAVRREVFTELGGFDERYFVYNEDMAFGRALREAGYGQRLRTDILVPHATSSSGGGGTKMPQQRGASMAQYLGDHNGKVSTLFMRGMLVVGMLPRISVSLLRRRPSIVRQHIAYIKGVVTMRSPYKQS